MSKQRLLSSSFKYKQQNPDYRGEKIDPQYVDGPIQRRTCTDLFCLLIFIVFLCAMGYVAYLGFSTGDPRLLASPFDQGGNQCEYAPGYQQFKLIFISNIINSSKISFVCVKQCPKDNVSEIMCKPFGDYSCSDFRPYPSESIVTFCLPQIDDDLNKIQDYLNVGSLQQWYSDLAVGWKLVAGMFGISLIYSLFYTLVMRICAGFIIWTFIVALILVTFAMGLFAFLITFSASLQELIHYKDLPQNMQDRDYQIATAVICWSISLITFLVVCCMKKQIRISIGIIKAAADFSRQQCLAFFLPFYATILQAIFLAFWVAVMLYLFSSTKDERQPIPSTPFSFVTWNQNVKWLTLFYLFGLLWIMMFISGMGSFWVCSTVAIWYFEKGQPTAPILRSIARSIKSIGSIAFGSLLIAIVLFIRILLQFLHASTLGADEVASAKILMRCASCLIACFERIVRFLTESAYIMMAISGKNFCSSAQEAFYLMVRSAAQYAISHGTTKIFMSMGKVLIICLCCFTGYMLITQIQYYRTQIFSPFFLTVIFAIVSYPIAGAFMQFFQMSANTLLMCYCLELDLVKGNPQKCPPSLRNFMEQYIKSSSQYSNA